METNPRHKPWAYRTVPDFPKPPAKRNPDTVAMDKIAELLDGTEWDAETLDKIAEIVKKSGREIREPVEDSDPRDQWPEPYDVAGNR